MRRDRAVAGACLVAAVALPLVGCVPTLAQDQTSSATSQTSGTANSTPQDRAGRVLTTDEAAAALPRMPTTGRDQDDWTETAGLTTDWSTQPDGCLDVMLLGESAMALEKHHVATAARSWKEATVAYAFYVSSYSTPVGPEPLDRAGAALDGCSTFTLTGTDGAEPFEEHHRVAALPGRPLGDQSLFVRRTTFDVAEGRNEEVYTDEAFARVGHNLIHVAATHRIRTTGAERIEAFAQEILDDLETP